MSETKAVDGVKGDLRDGRDWMAERLSLVDKQTRSFLTEHPILSLACAVGIGYLAARLLSAGRSRSRS